VFVYASALYGKFETEKLEYTNDLFP